MYEVNYYEIVIKKHHDDVVGFVRYAIDGEMFESQLHSIPELSNVLTLWRMGKLLGTIGVHPVAKDAAFQLMES